MNAGGSGTVENNESRLARKQWTEVKALANNRELFWMFVDALRSLVSKDYDDDDEIHPPDCY